MAFSLGMAFYHGATSGKEDRAVKIGSVLSLVVLYHKANNMKDVFRFIFGVPAKNKEIFGGVVYFAGALVVVETLIVHMARRALPGWYTACLERVGGVCVAAGLLLVFLSVRVLCRVEVHECGFIGKGVYRYIRHPYYLGMALILAGCSFLMRNLASVVISFYVLGSRVQELLEAEEEHSIEKNARYKEYRSRVWSGIPVWKQEEREKSR